MSSGIKSRFFIHGFRGHQSPPCAIFHHPDKKEILHSYVLGEATSWCRCLPDYFCLWCFAFILAIFPPLFFFSCQIPDQFLLSFFDDGFLHSLISHECHKQVEAQPCCLYCERRSLPIQKVILIWMKMFWQKVYSHEFNASDFQDICSSSHLWKMHGMQFKWHSDPLHKPQWRVIWRSGWLWKNDKMMIGLFKVFLVFMNKYFKIIFPLPFLFILSPQLKPLGLLQWMMHWFDSISVVKKFWKLSRKLWIKDLTALLGSQNCSMSSQSQMYIPYSLNQSYFDVIHGYRIL